MKRAILVAAGLSLCVSAAGACDFQRSAKAEANQTVVASATTEAAPPAQSTMIRQDTPSETSE